MEQARLKGDLKKSIIVGIERVERRRAGVFLIVSASACLTSIAGVILSVGYLLQSFVESGFSGYLALLVAGEGAVLAYSKEMAYALLETLPALGLVVLLCALGTFVWSGATTLSNFRRLSVAYQL